MLTDHSTFSKNRRGRFRDSELLRHLFEMTVARFIEEGLVSGQRMAVDASLNEADANKQNSTPKQDWDVSRIDPVDGGANEQRFTATRIGKPSPHLPFVPRAAIGCYPPKEFDLATVAITQAVPHQGRMRPQVVAMSESWLIGQSWITRKRLIDFND